MSVNLLLYCGAGKLEQVLKGIILLVYWMLGDSTTFNVKRKITSIRELDTRPAVPYLTLKGGWWGFLLP